MCQRCLMRQICNQCRSQCGNPFFWGGIGIVRSCGNGWNNGCNCNRWN